MLDLIRRNKTIFSVLVVVSALGMVIGLIYSPDIGRGATLKPNAVVAKVMGESVYLRELVEQINRQRAQMQEILDSQTSGMDAQNRAFYEHYMKTQLSPDRVLKQLIQNRFLVSLARQQGFRASEKSVAGMIQKNEFFFSEGRFDPVKYRQTLREPARYEKQIADQITSLQFLSAFQTAAGIVSPLERNLEERLNEERVFEIWRIRESSFENKFEPSEQEIATFLALPDSQKALESEWVLAKSEFEKPEQVRASHILIKESSSAGRKKADEVKKEIESGKITFVEAAKKYSEDKSNSEQGGSLGTFARGIMDPDFEKAAFSGDLGKILGPVKTSFGHHLILVEEKIPAIFVSLEEVKTKVAARVLKKNKKSEAMNALAQEIIQSSGKIKNLKEVEVKKLSPWKLRDPYLQEIGNVDSYLSDLLSLNESNPILKKPIFLGRDQIVVRWVSSGKSEKTKPFEGLSKADRLLQDYLERSYKDFEKSQEIWTNEKLIASLRLE